VIDHPAFPDQRRRLARLALRHGTALALDDEVAPTAERDAEYLRRLHRGRCRALWRTDPTTPLPEATS
jgi:hypothetical protein